MDDLPILQHEQIVIFIGVYPVSKMHFRPDFSSNRITFGNDPDDFH